MDNKLKGHIFVACAGALFGGIIFGGQVFANLGLSLFELSTLPYIFSLIFLFPFIIQRKYWVKKNVLFLLFLFGLVEVFCTVLQFAGLIFGASVAVVVLLLYAQPLWTTIIGFFFLKEKVSRWQLIACALVLLGVVCLIDLSNIFQSKSMLGVFAALFGGIFLSLWVVLGSVASKRKIQPVSIKFYAAVISLTLLFILFPLLSIFYYSPNIMGFSLNWPIWIWFGLAIYNLFTITFGHILYFTGAKNIPTVSSGILLLLEPVVGVLLSVLFLSQSLTLSIIFGGLLILSGNALVVLKAN